MLNEMAPYDDDVSAAGMDDASPTNGSVAALRAAVAEVFQIETEQLRPQPGVTAAFTGFLLLDSEAAYEQLEARLAPLGHTPAFRQQGGVQSVHLIAERFNPAPRPWWPNAVLFGLTLLSLLYVGAQVALGDAASPEALNLLDGWPYALSIVLILGAHELGHYFAARRHGVPVTLPYFIPFPIGIFGTLGAFIQLRAPMRNRKVLFDVGAAGPLAGLIFAVPILLIGLATSSVTPLPGDQAYMLEGNSLLYALAKIVTFGRFLPDGRVDVFLNQLAMAGWTGLFVTGLNLIPVGQLDGGHVMYTLLGDRARGLYLPAMLAMGFLALMVSEAWLLWLMLLLVFGRAYATPLDALTPLDGRRRALAVLALLIFVLVFVPNPMQIVEPSAAGGGPPLEMF